MEVNNGRELISNRPGLSVQEPLASANAAGRYEDLEAGLTCSQIMDKPVTAKSGNGSAALEKVGSVEYTRNNDFDDVNGSLMQDSPPTSRFAVWRAQSDQAMIRCIKEDDTHHTYFTRPPVNPITMFFKDHQMELDYRKKAWQSRDERRSSHGQSGVIMEGQGSPHHGGQTTRTWSPSGFNAAFDLVLSILTFLIVCIGKLSVHFAIAVR